MQTQHLYKRLTSIRQIRRRLLRNLAGIFSLDTLSLLHLVTSMLTLLKKIFLKNEEELSDAERRGAYGTLCGFLGVGLNLLLFGIKLACGIASSSIAVTADALNNLSDAGSSIVTLLGFHLAGQKPDKEHPFGHGRMEYVSGFVVAVVIILMGYELVKSSVNRIITPEPVEMNLLVFILLGVSICVKLYMVFYNRKVGRQINSAAMLATADDSRNDCIATTAVLFSGVAGKIFDVQIDGICGLLVGLFVLYSGICTARQTISPLLGERPSEDFVKDIERLVLANKTIQGIHDLVIHDYGPGRRMISLHAEVPADGDFIKLHELIDNVEREIEEKLHSEIVIHMDPIANNDAAVNEIRDKVYAAVKGIDEHLSMHDFRMVPGEGTTRLLFDVVVPVGFVQTNAELISAIEVEIKKLNSTYAPLIRIDKSFV